MHCFPSNFWRNKITNNKESDKCDLCKDLSVSKGRITTERTLPIQTLGHIQHTCEVLSELHTMSHHRYWCLIHGEFSHLSSSKWRFICINKMLPHGVVRTRPGISIGFNQYVEQTIWNVARDIELTRPLNQSEETRRQKGIPRKQIVQDRFWNKRPDGITFKISAVCRSSSTWTEDLTRDCRDTKWLSDNKHTDLSNPRKTGQGWSAYWSSSACPTSPVTI